MPSIDDFIKTQKNKPQKQRIKPSSETEYQEHPHTEKKLIRPWNIHSKETLNSLNQSESFEKTADKVETKSSLKRRQSEDKVGTNRGQSGDKTEDKVGTNRGQSEDKPRTKSSSKSPIRGQSRDRTEDTFEDKVRTKWGQSEDKTTHFHSFSELVGLQKKVLILLYQSCLSNQSQNTEKLAISTLSDRLQSPVLSVKKTIQRLEKKGLIIREKFKTGRSGWSIYSLPKTVYQDILKIEFEDKVRTKWGQSEDKVETKVGTEPRTSAPSSSSNIYITTTTDENNFQLPEDWKNIQTEKLSTIQFGQKQLEQIFKQTQKLSSPISADMVQHSIDAFAYALEHKKENIKTNPLNFFMGILTKGQIYNAPEGYESEQAKSLRLYLEQEKEEEKKRQKALEELFNIHANRWLDQLSEQKRIHILPSVLKNRPHSEGAINSLRAYFRETDWPKIKQNLPGISK